MSNWTDAQEEEFLTWWHSLTAIADVHPWSRRQWARMGWEAALQARKKNEEIRMGYMTNGLTFNALRGANQARLPQFRNSKGELTHGPGIAAWIPAQWLQGLVGEIGEYSNIRKKYERGDIDLATFTACARDELADVQVYLDLLADAVGVNLGEATIDKFNRVSERVGSNVRLGMGDWYYNSDK